MNCRLSSRRKRSQCVEYVVTCCARPGNPTEQVAHGILAKITGQNRSTARGVEEPFATITGSDGHHALVEADVDALLPECGFRMLTPEELKLGMAFAQSYIITGNKREQVKQVGNAVTPPVAQAIAQRCVESLAS